MGVMKIGDKLLRFLQVEGEPNQDGYSSFKRHGSETDREGCKDSFQDQQLWTS